MPMMMQMSSTQVIFGLAAARPGKKMQQENSPRSSIPGPMPRDREGESIPTNAMHYLFQGRLGSRAGPSDRLGLVAVEQQSLVACSPVDQGNQDGPTRLSIADEVEVVVLVVALAAIDECSATIWQKGCILLLFYTSFLSSFLWLFFSPPFAILPPRLVASDIRSKEGEERERESERTQRGRETFRCIAALILSCDRVIAGPSSVDCRTPQRWACLCLSTRNA